MTDHTLDKKKHVKGYEILNGLGTVRYFFVQMKII